MKKNEENTIAEGIERAKQFIEEKTERQALLNQLLDEEMNYLRINAYPWKRRNFLDCKVTIEEFDGTSLNAIGLYKSEEVKELEYIHHIYVGKYLLNNYINENDDKWYKNFIRNKIKTTIRHELCHAFVKEKLCWMSDIKGLDYDSSPIFCALLYYFETPSNHSYFSFYNTSLGKKASEYRKLRRYGNYKAFDEFIDYLILCIVKFNQVSRNLERKTEVIKSNDNKKIIQNESANIFTFSDKSYGLNKYLKTEDKHISYIKNNNARLLLTLNMNTYFWDIGCNISPENLEKVVNKKQGNDITTFNIKEKNKVYSYNGKTIKSINYYDEFNELRKKRTAKTGGGSDV